MKNQKGKTFKTLWGQMLSMLLSMWLLPLLVLIIIIAMVFSVRMNAQMDRTIKRSLEKAVEICNLRINDCIEQSKDISYNPELQSIYKAYQENPEDSAVYYRMTTLLEQEYKFNPDFKMTGLVFVDNPDKLYYTGQTYEPFSYKYYKNTAKDLILDAAADIGTDTVLLPVGTHVYLIRNIVTHDYEPYAVLFIDLNSTVIMESLESVWQYQGYRVVCDGTVLEDSGFGRYTGLEAALESGENSEVMMSEDSSYVYQSQKISGSRVLYAVSFDRAAVNAELNSSMYILTILILFLVPLIFMVFRFFNRRVSAPVAELAKASGEISKENFGITVPVHKNYGEITDLEINFNEMSRKLKTQFDKIYLEEIALRDANIHALQSQINPHFLNNTLEIINWTARMGDNEKVCRMIEALSTMMSATTNREKKDLVSLKDEMSYVHAYLYIISCRFGDKFHWSETIDDSALSCMVPRLIIQPIVENAVEHGQDENGNGSVSLTITGGCAKEETLHIAIINKGVPSAEEQQKIDALLSDDPNADISHSSHIGIRNVNRRLGIIYGKDSGLTIASDGQGNTVSTILIKKSQD